MNKSLTLETTSVALPVIRVPAAAWLKSSLTTWCLFHRGSKLTLQAQHGDVVKYYVMRYCSNYKLLIIAWLLHIINSFCRAMCQFGSKINAFRTSLCRDCLQSRTGLPYRAGKFSLTGPHYRAFSQKNINLLIYLLMATDPPGISRSVSCTCSVPARVSSSKKGAFTFPWHNTWLWSLLEFWSWPDMWNLSELQRKRCRTKWWR